MYRFLICSIVTSSTSTNVGAIPINLEYFKARKPKKDTEPAFAEILDEAKIGFRRVVSRLTNPSGGSAFFLIAECEDGKVKLFGTEGAPKDKEYTSCGLYFHLAGAPVETSRSIIDQNQNPVPDFTKFVVNYIGFTARNLVQRQREHFTHAKANVDKKPVLQTSLVFAPQVDESIPFTLTNTSRVPILCVPCEATVASFLEQYLCARFKFPWNTVGNTESGKVHSRQTDKKLGLGELLGVLLAGLSESSPPLLPRQGEYLIVKFAHGIAVASVDYHHSGRLVENMLFDSDMIEKNVIEDDE